MERYERGWCTRSAGVTALDRSIHRVLREDNWAECTCNCEINWAECICNCDRATRPSAHETVRRKLGRVQKQM